MWFLGSGEAFSKTFQPKARGSGLLLVSPDNPFHYPSTQGEAGPEGEAQELPAARQGRGCRVLAWVVGPSLWPERCGSCFLGCLGSRGLGLPGLVLSIRGVVCVHGCVAPAGAGVIPLRHGGSCHLSDRPGLRRELGSCFGSWKREAWTVGRTPALLRPQLVMPSCQLRPLVCTELPYCGQTPRAGCQLGLGQPPDAHQQMPLRSW